MVVTVDALGEPRAVLDRAGRFLTDDPVLSNVVLTLLHARVADPEPGRYWVASSSGNVTGVAFVGPEYGKRLEILKELRPNLARVALIYNPENRGSVLALGETQRLTKNLGISLEPHQFRGPQDFPALFAAIEKKLPDGLMTTADPLIASHRVPIVEFATRHRLVSMYPGLEFVEAGGLMFYGGSIAEMYRMAGVYIDRIFRGAAPQDLPVEQPIKFDMVINAGAAKALGVTIPRTLLLRADQVIR